LLPVDTEPPLPPPPVAEYAIAVYEEEEPLNVRSLAKDELMLLTCDIAEEYGVSCETMLHIVEAESQWVTDARGDMNLTCKLDGLPVKARGLAQITRCYYPTVSDEEADDPIFALHFLAEKLSEGQCKSQWSTCPE
jgi:hypothetical protein